MSNDLTGKTAVVTGATSGIGLATAERLLDAGATVVGLGRSAQKLESLARFGTAFVPCVVDLAEEGPRSAALAAVADAHPRVDIVVSNAAECLYESPLTASLDAYRRLLEVNALAGIELVQALAPRMKPGGHIVQLSSVTARHLPAARFAPYAMSKALGDHFIEALRLELHPRGVKVSLVVPGLVETPIYDNVKGFAATRAKLNEHVTKWLDPGDVADAIVWMLTRPAHVAVSEVVIMPREQAR